MTERVSSVATRRSMRGGMLAAIAGVALSCAPSTGMQHADPTQAAAVQVVVRNHHWHDVRIFAVHGGQRHRIGTVTAALPGRLRLPSRLLGSQRTVQLLAVAIGGRTRVLTEVLRVSPGQRIVWTLESDLDRSSAAVW